MELDKIVTADPNKVTTYTFHTLSLTKTSPNGKTSALRWAIRNGYPRATLVKDVDLKSEDRQARLNNFQTYPLDSLRLITALTEWIKILRGSSKEMDTVALNVFYPRTQDGMTNRNYIGKLTFGLNKGVPFIMASVGEQQGHTFYFTANTQFVEFEKNNQAVNMSRELGASYAQALIRHLEGAYMKYASSYVSDKKEYGKDVKVEEQPPKETYTPQPQPAPQPQPPMQEARVQEPDHVEVQQADQSENYANAMMGGAEI